MREYPDMAAFEWAIRAERELAPAGASEDAGPGVEPGFSTFREIIEGIVADAHQRGELGDQPDPRGTIEAIYALIFGLTELAATLPPEDFQAALGSAKQLVRGTLFGHR